MAWIPGGPEPQYQDIPGDASSALDGMSDAEIEQILGPAPAAPELGPAESFNVSPMDAFLERIAPGLAGIQFRQPRGFAQGLVSGLTRGFGARGQNIATARQKFDQRQQARQLKVDEERRKATEDYNKRKASLREKVGTQGLEDVPIDERMVKQYPQLADWQGSKMSKSVFDRVTGEKSLGRIESEHAAMARGTERGGGGGGGGAGGQEAVMSPRALAARVAMFRAGGPEPSFGMGKAGVANRVAFNEELAKQLEKEGVTGADVMAGRATQAADKASLANLTKQLGTVNAAEETVKNNTKILAGTIEKIPDSGVPFLNQFMRPGAEKLFGSKDVTNFNTALGTVQKEFARILNSGTAGGSALTEGARHDLESSLGRNFTKSQLRGALKILDLDARNRTQSLQNEIDATKKRLSGIGLPAAVPTVPGVMTASEADRAYAKSLGLK